MPCLRRQAARCTNRRTDRQTVRFRFLLRQKPVRQVRQRVRRQLHWLFLQQVRKRCYRFRRSACRWQKRRLLGGGFGSGFRCGSICSGYRSGLAFCRRSRSFGHCGFGFGSNGRFFRFCFGRGNFCFRFFNRFFDRFLYRFLYRCLFGRFRRHGCSFGFGFRRLRFGLFRFDFLGAAALILFRFGM